MTKGRPASLALLAVAAIVAACSATVTPTPTPATTAAPTPISTPSPTPSAPPSPTPSPSLPGDWPVYHLNAQHTGYAADFPAFSGTLTQAWSAKLDGAVFAEPLVVHGRAIVATLGDSIYALDPMSGATIWKQNLGTPVRVSTLPCGDVDPLGILGTPVYDPASNTLFAVAEVTGPKHILFALNPDTGATLWSRSVDVASDNPTNHQQRPALAVGNGYVYIGFGGLSGDCAQYTGKVVGVPTDGQGASILYRVPVQREGAVWASGGPVLDPEGNLYVSTGNGSSTSVYDGSDSVLELSPALQLLSRFAPKGWASDNANDLDLGSLAPVIVPGGWIFIAGKSGTGYVLRQGSLGGIGGQVSSGGVCAGFGGAAEVGTTIFLGCEESLTAVTVGADGSIHVNWKSTSARYSPVVGGGAVWALSEDGLVALDVSTGKVLGSIGLGTSPHFASPTLWNGLVLVGTLGGVVAVKGQ